jgi:hypothetical protein
MKQAHESLSNVTDEIQNLRQQIEEEMKFQAEQSEILMKKKRIENEIEKLVGDIEKERVRIDTLRKTLKKDMTHLPRHELNSLLESFDTDLDNTRQRLRDEERNFQQILETNQNHKKRLMELTQHKGVLLGEKSTYDNDLKRRVEIITQIHEQFELRYDPTEGTGMIQEFGTQSSAIGRSILSQGSETTFGRFSMLSQESSPMVSDEELSIFHQAIKVKQEEMIAELAAMKKQHQREDDEFQAAMSESTAKVKEMEAGMFMFNIHCILTRR